MIIVETPLATLSVCMPSIFHLLNRGFYRGMPALFSTQDPSKPIGGKHGKHIGRLGNPVDTEVRHVERLIDLGLRESQQSYLSTAPASRAMEPRSEDIRLEDMHVRNGVDVPGVRRIGDPKDMGDKAV